MPTFYYINVVEISQKIKKLYKKFKYLDLHSNVKYNIFCLK